ncbi:MAG: YigZ family protein, partial [Clostridia bacterium]|nr:YigZ family protein [Clostridia bacterium]
MQYKTVRNSGSDEFTEQRSRFIGYVCPVKTEAEALAFINEKKKLHWDARHNVYAYVLRESGIQRYSDDGEPHGTAGVPVLDIIVKSGITDVVVVVTRYFGGILLGTGGLVRAYTKGASIALKAGNIITMQSCNICSLSCDYTRYG